MRVLHVKIAANEMSDLFAKVGTLQADSDSSNPSEIFQKTFSLIKFLIEMNYIVIANYLINLSWFYLCTQDGKTYREHIWVVLTLHAVFPSYVILAH